MMRNHRPKGRSRFRPTNRRFRDNGMNHSSSNSHSNSNGMRSGVFRNNQSAPKLLEKYNLLAKEAMSSGDKVLSENYLQHAEHYLRIIASRNNIGTVNKNQTSATPNNSISNAQELNNDKEIKEDKKEVEEIDIEAKSREDLKHILK